MSQRWGRFLWTFYRVCQGLLEEKLSVVSDDLSLNPIVLANSWVGVAALCAPLTSLMIWVVATPSASYMGLFTSELAHRCSAFCHFALRFSLHYFGGGEIMTTLSPLTTIVPSSLDLPSSRISTESSSNRFICWSKPWRFPLMTLPPLSLIRTTFPRLSSRTFTAISTDN